MTNSWDGIQGSGHSICLPCIYTCHANHEVKYVRYGPHYCHCGEKGEPSCKALKEQVCKYVIDKYLT